jgi:hypothetical protein
MEQDEDQKSADSEAAEKQRTDIVNSITQRIAKMQTKANRATTQAQRGQLVVQGWMRRTSSIASVEARLRMGPVKRTYGQHGNVHANCNGRDMQHLELGDFRSVTVTYEGQILKQCTMCDGCHFNGAKCQRCTLIVTLPMSTPTVVIEKALNDANYDQCYAEGLKLYHKDHANVYRISVEEANMTKCIHTMGNIQGSATTLCVQAHTQCCYKCGSPKHKSYTCSIKRVPIDETAIAQNERAKARAKEPAQERQTPAKMSLNASAPTFEPSPTPAPPTEATTSSKKKKKKKNKSKTTPKTIPTTTTKKTQKVVRAALTKAASTVAQATTREFNLEPVWTLVGGNGIIDSKESDEEFEANIEPDKVLEVDDQQVLMQWRWTEESGKDASQPPEPSWTTKKRLAETFTRTNLANAIEHVDRTQNNPFEHLQPIVEEASEVETEIEENSEEEEEEEEEKQDTAPPRKARTARTPVQTRSASRAASRMTETTTPTSSSKTKKGSRKLAAARK